MKKYLIIALLALILPSCGGNKTAESNANQDSTQTLNNTGEVGNAEVDTLKLPTMIDISATWCGPCQMIAPTVHELEKQYDGKIKFEFVDIDEAPSIKEEYNIEAVPTFIFLDADGKEVHRIVGANEEELRSSLENLAK